MKNVSLARALSKLGFTSRSLGTELVLSGRVMVNGRTIRNPAFRCDMDADRITVDRTELPVKEPLVIMLNKPRGVLTTRSDELGRSSIYELLGEMRKWIFPVGRLDKESEGLLLCTNDNALGEALTNPDSHIPKVYRVTADRQLNQTEIVRFQEGMELDGELLRPAVVRATGKSSTGGWFEIVLVEGKNRQIRRMCAAVGVEVTALKRIAIGPLHLGELQPGAYRKLTQAEMRALKLAAFGPASPRVHRIQRTRGEQ